MAFFIVIEKQKEKLKSENDRIQCIKVERLEDLEPLMQLKSGTMLVVKNGNGTNEETELLEGHKAYKKKYDGFEMLSRALSACENLFMKKKFSLPGNILPVCCVCKKIRDDKGEVPGYGKWMGIEEYMFKKADIQVTSSYCPECAKIILNKMNI